MIPGYQEFMCPSLHIFKDGQIHKTRDIYDILVIEFSLTEEQRAQCWAHTYLYKAGLLEQVERGPTELRKVEGRF